MSLASNLIELRGLVNTSSGSKTGYVAKQSSNTDSLNFSSFLQTKLQGESGKNWELRRSETIQAKPDSLVEDKKSDEVSSTAAGTDSNDPGNKLDATARDSADIQSSPTSPKVVVREGERQQSDSTQSGGKTDTGTGINPKSELEDDPKKDLSSDPEVQNILALLTQLVLLAANQASPEDGANKGTVEKVGTSGEPGQSNQSLQAVLATLMQKVASSTGTEPTLQMTSSQLEKFAEQLESLLGTIGSSNPDTAPVSKDGALNQSVIFENLISQSGEGTVPKTITQPNPNTAMEFSSLINRLGEALQRLEVNSQAATSSDPSKNNQSATPGDATDQAKTMENLVRNCLQMIRSAVVTNKTAATYEPTSTVSLTESAKPETATGLNLLSEAANTKSTEPEKGATDQSASQQNGSSGEKASESKLVNQLTKEDTEASGLKTESQTQSEQKPTTVLVNMGSGIPDQRVNETLLKSPQNAEMQPQQLIKPIIEGMRLINRDTRTEMNIQLQPESLGKLNLKVSVENGLVTAKLVAESQTVGKLIESSLGQLKQSLQEQGLRFDRIEVSVGDSSAQPDLSQQFGRQYQNQAGGNQSSKANYGGGIDSEMNYNPLEPSSTIGRYSGESQYDFLA